MKPSRPFILRPVATSLLMVALFLSGVIAYRLLPLSALPEVSYPTIQILTLYPGASPDVMTTSVTAPLERQLGQIPGLNQMSSTTSGAASVLTLLFILDVSIDSHAQRHIPSIGLPPPRRSTARSIRPTRPCSRSRLPRNPCRCPRCRISSTRGSDRRSRNFRGPYWCGAPASNGPPSESRPT